MKCRSFLKVISWRPHSRPLGALSLVCGRERRERREGDWNPESRVEEKASEDAGRMRGNGRGGRGGNRIGLLLANYWIRHCVCMFLLRRYVGGITANRNLRGYVVALSASSLLQGWLPGCRTASCSRWHDTSRQDGLNLRSKSNICAVESIAPIQSEITELQHQRRLITTRAQLAIFELGLPSPFWPQLDAMKISWWYA